MVDASTANHEVRIWLDTVANTRLHSTLDERPCDRYEVERASLALLPLPYGGKRLAQRSDIVRVPRVPVPGESIQHPLSIYSDLAEEVMASLS
jgi:hypothetical protein